MQEISKEVHQSQEYVIQSASVNFKGNQINAYDKPHQFVKQYSEIGNIVRYSKFLKQKCMISLSYLVYRTSQI